MSDFGDDMRAWRKRKQEQRRKLPECQCGRKLYPTDKTCPTCGRERQ